MKSDTSVMGSVAAYSPGRLVPIAIGGAVVGAVGLVVCAALDGGAALSAYLVAYAYWFTLAVGALIFLMTCNAMRAGWPVLLRRLLEATSAVLPALAVLAVPLFVFVARLYPWASPAPLTDEHVLHLLEHKRPYLNVPFFVGRGIVYVIVWSAVAQALRAWSVRKDRDAGAPVEPKILAASAVLLPLVGLTFSFASFDWLMSLTPTWVSSMFPVYVFGGGFLAALALLTVLTRLADTRGLVRGVSSSHYYALGRLLLAFVIFWAYAGFFQFLIIWIADKPDEVAYFVPRMQGPGGVVSMVLIVFHFVVPFAILLNYRIKRDGRRLARVAALLLVVHYVDVHWLVAPSVRGGATWRVADLFAALFVTGVVVLAGALRQRGLALVPLHDPQLAEALRYDSV